MEMAFPSKHTEQDVLNKVQLLVENPACTGWYIRDDRQTAYFVANAIGFHVDGKADTKFRVEIYPVYCKTPPVIIYKDRIHYDDEIWKNTADPDVLMSVVEHLLKQTSEKPGVDYNCRDKG